MPTTDGRGLMTMKMSNIGSHRVRVGTAYSFEAVSNSWVGLCSYSLEWTTGEAAPAYGSSIQGDRPFTTKGMDS